MIISIKNDEGAVNNFDVTAIADEQKKNDATVMVNKVGNLSVVIEALDFASRTHRANLEELLKGCPESQVEESAEESTEDSEET